MVVDDENVVLVGRGEEEANFDDCNDEPSNSNLRVPRIDRSEHNLESILRRSGEKRRLGS